MEAPRRQPQELNREETAATRTERNRQVHLWARRQAVLLGVIRAVICCVVLFFVLLEGVAVTGASMAPTILPGEVLLSLKNALYLRQPQRGDVLVRRHGRQVLRVVALAGERVSCFEGQVYVDGQLLEEPYAQGQLPGAPEQAVPEGCVYLLPDNRNGALGVVASFDEVAGRVVLRVSPLQRAALF